MNYQYLRDKPTRFESLTGYTLIVYFTINWTMSESRELRDCELVFLLVFLVFS